MKTYHFWRELEKLRKGFKNDELSLSDKEKLLEFEHINKALSMPDVGQSFGCEARFCQAVIDKKGNASCEKCTKYMKNIAP